MRLYDFFRNYSSIVNCNLALDHNLQIFDSHSLRGEREPVLIYQILKAEFDKYNKPIFVNFREIVDWVKLGDQLTHQIHSYPAKLLPHIANLFSQALVPKLEADKIILDPFGGSGTIALEASLYGYSTYIADINPLACLISKVKTTPYNCLELNFHLDKIILNSKRYRVADEIDIVNSSLWYSAKRKRALEVILRAVMEISEPEIRDFFKICFSVVARRFSNADLSISVPVKLKLKDSFSPERKIAVIKRLSWLESANPLEEFQKIAFANIERVRKTNHLRPDRKKTQVISNDVKELINDCKKINFKTPLVITSPPYGSAQKYIRASSLSLNWLGLASPDKLPTLEKSMIGREHISSKILVEKDNLPYNFEILLNTIKGKNNQRYLITKHFLLEMRIALTNIYEVTKSNGYIVLVTGNNMVCNEFLYNDDFIIEIITSLGGKLELHLIDNIKSRGLMVKRNKTASIISRESILVFSK